MNNNTTRNRSIDILKAILIICVVYGHTSQNEWIDVFWFHIPAFFVISGHFIKPSTILSQTYIKELILRYVIPYFCWCIIMYIIFRPEHPLKNIVRVLYGGHNNITLYSYPYWFINTLFISNILFITIITISQKVNNSKSKYIVAIIIILLYTTAHFLLPLKALPPLPWGIDNACCVIIYIYIGNHIKNILFKWDTFICLVPFIFIIICYYFNFNYKINIASIHLEHYILDIIVPLSFTLMLFKISSFISLIPIISTILSKIGEYSLTIFFTHTAILYLYNGWYGILLSIIIGCLLHKSFLNFKLTKILFLGKY